MKKLSKKISIRQISIKPLMWKVSWAIVLTKRLINEPERCPTNGGYTQSAHGPAELGFKAFLITFQLEYDDKKQSIKYLISSLKVKLRLNEDIDLLLKLKTWEGKQRIKSDILWDRNIYVKL